MYQLQETSHGFHRGYEYAVLAQQIAETNEDNDQDNELRSKILADSYRFQGIIGSYLDTDILPIAYTEYGRALMRVPDEKEALRCWEIASDTISERTKAGELPFPYPWFHRALVYAFDGQADLAETIILPILEEREKKLGKDDTKTYE